MGKKDYSQKYYYRYDYYNKYQDYTVSYRLKYPCNKEYYDYYFLYEDYIKTKRETPTDIVKNRLYKPPPPPILPPPPRFKSKDDFFQKDQETAYFPPPKYSKMIKDLIQHLHLIFLVV